MPNRLSRRGVLSAAALAAASSSASSARAAETPGELARNVVDLGTVDVLVCGGGPSGVAAAAMAARGGARTLLVERYGRLGGMATLAAVHPLLGRVKSPFVGEVVKRLGGTGVDFERIDLHYADLLQQAGADLLLHAWMACATVEDGAVRGATFLAKDGLLRARAAVTVDATGDGDVAASAGAPFEQGRPGDKLVQPMSIMYRISGVGEKAFCCGSEEAARKLKIGGKTWEQIVAEGQKAGELPATISVIRTYACPRRGDRGVNATQVNGVDGTRARDLTRAELEGRRQAAAVLEFLRKHAPGYENAYLSLMPAVVGVRETRRVLGVEYLDRKDLIAGRRRDDAVVREANFVIDIHNPAGGGQAEGLAARVKPYDIPYGCLVPKTLDGLLLAGRCISGSHDAHASYRVQCIAMAIGAAAGAAAALAARGKTPPRRLAPADVRKALNLGS